MALTFQLVSDLHLEISASSYETYTIPAHTPNLFLLGDIGLTTHGALFTSFLPRHLQTFTRIFYVLGNHEAYHTSYPAAARTVANFAGSWNATRSPAHGELVLLDRTRYDFTDCNVSVLGCTLFSAVPAAQQEALRAGLNDFALIHGWTVGGHDAAHAEEVRWLNCEVRRCEAEGRGVVVVTHHAPSVDGRAGDPRFEGSALSAGFRSDLRGEVCWESEVVKVWAWGHTHYNWEAMGRGVVTTGGGGRCVANMRGYAFAECTGFDAGRVYTVDKERAVTK